MLADNRNISAFAKGFYEVKNAVDSDSENLGNGSWQTNEVSTLHSVDHKTLISLYNTFIM